MSKTKTENKGEVGTLVYWQKRALESEEKLHTAYRLLNGLKHAYLVQLEDPGCVANRLLIQEAEDFLAQG